MIIMILNDTTDDDFLELGCRKYFLDWIVWIFWDEAHDLKADHGRV